MKARILEINPECQVITKETFVNADNVAEIIGTEADYVVDAIDTVTSKLDIIQYCKENNINVIQGHGYNECIVKGDIETKNDDLKPVKVIMTTGAVTISDKYVKNDKVEVEGVLKVCVIYASEDDEHYLVNMEDEIPFSAKVDIAGTNPNMQAVASVALESIEGSLEGGNINIRAVVRVL